MQRPAIRLYVSVIALLVLVGGPAAAQQQGELPEAAQQELERRDMTVQEARQRRRQRGIDPPNPGHPWSKLPQVYLVGVSGPIPGHTFAQRGTNQEGPRA